jgi:Ser/Thr protein kinase RdoA (MazF antagonist)
MTLKENEPLPSGRMLADICSAWQLSDLRFVRKMENIVYRASKNQETVYLRLTSPLRRDPSQILAELDWILFLQKNGLPVVDVIRNERGSFVETFTDGEIRFEACLFRSITGLHPSHGQARHRNFLHDLGALVATMHNATELYEAPIGIHREVWYEERGFRHAKQAVSRTSNIFMKENFDNARRWLEGLPQSKQNYGLVHADLITHNLFIDETGRIHVIDFDDSCYHWHVFDLAIILCHLADGDEHEKATKEEDIWLEHLLHGYRSVRALDEAEAKNIPKFMHFAHCRLYFWIEDHQRLETFTDNAKIPVEKIKQRAEARVRNYTLRP